MQVEQRYFFLLRNFANDRGILAMSVDQLALR